MARVTVVGTTSWGTTLGILLARRGIPVTLLARTPEEAGTLTQDRENRRLLPGTPFPDPLTASSDANAALDGADLVVLATPAQRLRGNLPALRGHLRDDTVVLSAIKGLELDTGLPMTQVIQMPSSRRLEKTASASSPAPTSPVRSWTTSPPPPSSPARTPPSPSGCRSSSTHPVSACTPTTTSWAWSWAAPSRTPSPSPRASATASATGPTPRPPSSRGDWRR